MLSTKDVMNMRSTQAAHMHDTARVLSFTAGAVNEYNEQDSPTYPAGEPFLCGVDVGAGSERDNQRMTVIEYDAILRAPLSLYVTEKDRIEILTRFGFDVDPLIYEIVSPPRRGGTAVRLLLRKVSA